MKLFSLFTAALIALPVLASARVIEIDLTLRFDSFIIDNATLKRYVVESEGDSPTPRTERLGNVLGLSDEMFPWFYNGPLSDSRVGDLISFKTTIDTEFESFYGFGRATSCTLDAFNCRTGTYGEATVQDGILDLFSDNSAFFGIDGSIAVGGQLNFLWCRGYVTPCDYFYGSDGLFGDDYEINWGDTNYAFTVVRDNLAPIAAPVPVPASLPFLAAGLAGFSILRRFKSVKGSASA